LKERLAGVLLKARRGRKDKAASGRVRPGPGGPPPGPAPPPRRASGLELAVTPWCRCGVLASVG